MTIIYTVYILKDKHGSLYKGVTNDLGRRLREHRAGGTKTTAKMEDVCVVYSEEFRDFRTARKREVYFKTAAGRRTLKKLIP